MNDPRLGAAIRALRRRRGWRQLDLAMAAGVSQPLICDLEAGRIGGLNWDTLRTVAAALDATASIDLRWRGATLDRLLDEKHAGILGATIGLLGQQDWRTEVEVTYSVYGERGSIDILAWHAASQTLLVIEGKSELVSVEATLRKLDEKDRLAASIARERFGWQSRAIARMLVLPSTTTERRRVARHGATLDAALPLRSDEMRTWLRRPVGSASGILFVADITVRDTRNGNVTASRVRRAPAARNRG